MGGVSESIEISVPPEKFFEVVMDFPKYPEFASSVLHAEVKKKDGNKVEVYFELNLIKKVKYTLKMLADPPKKLSWELVGGDLFKVNSGSWELKPIKGGKGTKATYTTDVEFSVFVPKMITNKLAAVSLPQSLKEFKERAEELFA